MSSTVVNLLESDDAHCAEKRLVQFLAETPMTRTVAMDFAYCVATCPVLNH